VEKQTQDGLDFNDRWPAVSLASVSHRLATTGCNSGAVLHLYRCGGGRLYRVRYGR
jgi:hypothetical protein